MIFVIEYKSNISYKSLLYRENEYSFDMEPESTSYDYALTINKLFIPINNYNCEHISGVCGHHNWNRTKLQVPSSQKGKLKIEMSDYEKENKEIFEIIDNNDKVFFDIENEWVCIGDPQKKGHAVEFIPNCIIVIDDEGHFISLWLKPLVCTSWQKVYENN